MIVLFVFLAIGAAFGELAGAFDELRLALASIGAAAVSVLAVRWGNLEGVGAIVAGGGLAQLLTYGQLWILAWTTTISLIADPRPGILASAAVTLAGATLMILGSIRRMIRARPPLKSPLARPMR